MPALADTVQDVLHLILHRDGASLQDLEGALARLLKRTLRLPSRIDWTGEDGPSRYTLFREQIGLHWPELGFYDPRTGRRWTEQVDEIGDGVDDLADIAVDLDRTLHRLQAGDPGALSFLRFTAVTHWGAHVRDLLPHLRALRRHPPSAEVLGELLNAALPEGRLHQEGAERLLTFLNRVPPPLLPRVDETWRQVSRYGGYGEPGPAGWHQGDAEWHWRSNLPGWVDAHPDALLAAPGVVAALAGHADGYARKVAVGLLARMDHPLATAMLLIRAQDWVGAVRTAARDALQARLTDAHAPHWAHHAALIDRLEAGERGDPVLPQAARALLRKPAGLAAVEAALPRADEATRLALLRVVDALPEDHRAVWLGTFSGDPHAQVRRRVARIAAVHQLSPLLSDPDAGVREVALRRLLDASPGTDVPAFLRRALVDPRAGVRALAQFEARQRGVDLGAAYLDVTEPDLPLPALRGWVAGVRDLAVGAAESRVEALVTHPNVRIRAEVLRTLGALAPHRHVGLLEQGVLASGAQARISAAALRTANLLTFERLDALWARATTERQQRRLVVLAADLPRFDGAVLLLSWQAQRSGELQEWIQVRVTALLDGYGVRYYTRPQGSQRTDLELAARADGLHPSLSLLLRDLLT